MICTKIICRPDSIHRDYTQALNLFWTSKNLHYFSSKTLRNFSLSSFLVWVSYTVLARLESTGKNSVLWCSSRFADETLFWNIQHTCKFFLGIGKNFFFCVMEYPFIYLFQVASKGFFSPIHWHPLSSNHILRITLNRRFLSCNHLISPLLNLQTVLVRSDNLPCGQVFQVGTFVIPSQLHKRVPEYLTTTVIIDSNSFCNGLLVQPQAAGVEWLESE